MREFKFFQKNSEYNRTWLDSRYRGQLQWMYRDVGVIFYMERTHLNDNVYTEEIKTMSVVSTIRNIQSYNDFMEQNRNNIVFAYQFIDHENGGLTWNEQNFHNMPRDRPMIFRGVIRNYEII